MSTWSIVVGAGGGARFGGAKQFAHLGGSSVVDRAVATAQAVSDGVVVVLPVDALWDAPHGVLRADGGATRSDSVRAGLALVPDDATIVVVHDAARPLASYKLFAAVIDAVRAGADAAVPGVPVVDTVKRVVDDRVVETVPRDGLYAVQTPQAFRADVLRSAHQRGGIDTDDAALVELAGGTVVMVEGERRNLKLTLPDDLALAEAIIEGARS